MICEKPKIIIKTIINEEVLFDQTYSVIVHDDDTTLISIVIGILQEVFDKSLREALKITDIAQTEGNAVVCSGYSYLAANEKILKANEISKEYDCELKFTIEED